MYILLLLACQSAPAPAPPPPAAPQSTGAPAQAPAPAPPPPMPERLVAIGDLHADLPSTQQVLRLAGLIDARDRWVGGAAWFVQTGDVTDRGPDSLEVLRLLASLQGQAAAVGGRVVLINGNHETMNYLGDWRYVSPGDLADFGSPDARKAAFSAEGELGAAILSRPVVAAVGDTIFCHGGVSEGMAAMGVEGLNTAAARALLAGQKAPVLGDAGPLWYRGYLLNDEAVACAELKRSLQLLGANRMVVGHTTQESGQLAVRCGGSLLGIDTGISTHYGGHLAALELRRGDAWALYPSGPVDLPDPLRTGSAGQP